MREDKHGIHGFTEIRLPGAARAVQGIDDPRFSPWLVEQVSASLVSAGLLRQRPITSRQRRQLAVWNLLSDRDLRVGVVNWFASWPSDSVNGFMVSDNNPWRAAFNDQRVGMQSASRVDITWPPDLLTELMKIDMPTQPRSADAVPCLDLFSDLSDSEREKLASGNRTLLEVIRNIYLADQFAAEAGLYLMQRDQLDLLAVYLSGIDNLSHQLGHLPGVVDRYYQRVDTMLGRYMRLAGPRSTFVIVSDHGWDYGNSGKWGHKHAPDGILLMSGHGVRQNASLSQPPSLLDVTPTLLALYGLPPSRQMDGHVIEGALDSSVSMRPIAIDSYGSYRGDTENEVDTNEREPSELSEETLQKLRALGYIR